MSEHNKKWRKYGTRVLKVSATVIADIDSDKGVVVQAVRDSETGELLQNETFDLDAVKTNGLPIPNPMNLTDK